MRGYHCIGCFFWERLPGTIAEPKRGGLCHRYPPTENGKTFPHTREFDWCGEFVSWNAMVVPEPGGGFDENEARLSKD